MSFKNWLLSFFPSKPVNTAPAPSRLAIGITSDVGAVAGAVSASANLASKIVEVVDSPDMEKGRENVLLQKAKDKIRADAAEALQSGDVTEINKDLA